MILTLACSYVAPLANPAVGRFATSMIYAVGLLDVLHQPGRPVVRLDSLDVVLDAKALDDRPVYRAHKPNLEDKLRRIINCNFLITIPSGSYNHVAARSFFTAAPATAGGGGGGGAGAAAAAAPAGGVAGRGRGGQPAQQRRWTRLADVGTQLGLAEPFYAYTFTTAGAGSTPRLMLELMHPTQHSPQGPAGAPHALAYSAHVDRLIMLLRRAWEMGPAPLSLLGMTIHRDTGRGQLPLEFAIAQRAIELQTGAVRPLADLQPNQQLVLADAGIVDDATLAAWHTARVERGGDPWEGKPSFFAALLSIWGAAGGDASIALQREQAAANGVELWVQMALGGDAAVRAALDPTNPLAVTPEFLEALAREQAGDNARESIRVQREQAAANGVPLWVQMALGGDAAVRAALDPTNPQAITPELLEALAREQAGDYGRAGGVESIRVQRDQAAANGVELWVQMALGGAAVRAALVRGDTIATLIARARDHLTERSAAGFRASAASAKAVVRAALDFGY